MHSPEASTAWPASTGRRWQRVDRGSGSAARHLAAIARRRGLLIAVITLVGVTVLAVVVSRMTPVYEATALVTVGPRPTGLALDRDPRILLPGELGFVENEVVLVRSVDVLKRVVDQWNLVSQPEFGALDPEAADAGMQSLVALSDALDVSRIGVTYTLAITVTSEDPESAARLANSVAAAYIAVQRERFAMNLVDQREIAAAQFSSAVADLREASARAERYLRETVPPALGAAAPSPGPQPAEALPVLGDAEAVIGDALARLRLADPNATTAGIEDELLALLVETTIAKASHDAALRRLSELETAASTDPLNLAITSEALAPLDPAAANRTLLLAAGLLVVLGIAIAAALARERLGGFRREEIVEAELGIPAIASLPFLRHPFGLARQASEVVEAPLTEFSGEIRRARVQLGRLAGQTLLITSALPSEGKSLVAVSIARAASLAGHKVLLVEGNAVRPSVAIATGVEPSGAARLRPLAGEPESDAATDLTILPLPDGLSELDISLAAERIALFLSPAAQEFDLVVIDGPSLRRPSDATAFLQSATHVLLVLRGTPRGAASAALDELVRHNGKSAQIGVILNAVRRPRWWHL